MPHISDSDNVDSIHLQEQGATPSTPDAGYRRLYAKSDGIYQVDSSGTETKLGDDSLRLQWIGW
jgi:hypothetical protein